ncbi:MAG: hypothetical protein KME22_26835 [Hassallia sp. WJT32-NPBG1]|nr:hypothetical protein [Hassallia sp. WJT32-NPBG1]
MITSNFHLPTRAIATLVHACQGIISRLFLFRLLAPKNPSSASFKGSVRGLLWILTGHTRGSLKPFFTDFYRVVGQLVYLVVFQDFWRSPLN